jgi:hypothetical protein
MPASDPLFCFTSNKIESHPCTNCRAPMMHVRPAGSDQNTFECFNCDETANRLIERAAVPSAD